MTAAPAALLIFLLGLSTGEGAGHKRRSSPPTASLSVDFDCPEEFGYYAHPTDCTQYYVCVFGGALLESCTGGLMYSHELQTCDWPRNVGCGEGTIPASDPPPPPQPQTSEIRGRTSSSVNRGPTQAREQQHVPKHDLYTEEELGPAEEIELDRQQRVYRGQPPTIGQVASDRDAITHSNAIPVQASGGREKLSVVSYGGQQQYSRASVAPQQAYIESVTTAPRTTYNASQQYIAQQYDPYYTLYDEEDLYKDIDYSQYTANQGQRYRAQPSYKERKPTVEIIQQDPVQRGSSAYSKTKYNTQQDLFQPTVTQQDYESYSIQTNDDIQYRQPVQSKSSNRLAPIRGTEGTVGSREDKVVASPQESVERNFSTGNQRLALTSRLTHQNPVPYLPNLDKKQSETRTDDKSRQTTQKTESTSTNFSLQKFNANPPLQKRPGNIAEKRIDKGVQRQPFVIQVTTPIPPPTKQDEETLQRKSYEIIKSFLEEQRKSGQAPRPFRSRTESSNNEAAETKQYFGRESSPQSRNRFVVPTTDILEQTVRINPSQFRTTTESALKSTRTFPSRVRQQEYEDSNSRPNVGNRVPNPYAYGNERGNSFKTNEPRTTYDSHILPKLGPVIVEDYTITSKPISSRLNEDYVIKEEPPQRKTTQEPLNIELGSLVEDYTITTHRPSSIAILEQLSNRRTTTARPGRKSENTNFQSSYSDRSEYRESPQRKSYNRGTSHEQENQYVIKAEATPQRTEIKSSRLYDIDASYNKQLSDNQYGPSKAKAQKVYNKPTTHSSSFQETYYNRASAIERQTNSVPNYDHDNRNLKPILVTEPDDHLNDYNLDNDIDKKSFSIIPPKCTSNCTDKQILRVRPTSYDTQATPGITRGTTRHRGGLTYTVSPNDAEAAPPVHRGTPAVSRARPTLRPANTIVSKAAEYVDIYRYPPQRPGPVYPTPQVDKTAAKCRKDVCLLPDCYCGGKDVPGELPVEATPQIVLLTFDDSVNDLNKGLYSDLFEKGRTNPNGCPIAATFYVSHEWTDYSQVQNLYSAGHEIASHSVSHSFGEQFSQKRWTREIAGQREILSAYGGVKQEDIRGMRAPFLAVGGNKMFKMLYDTNFTYDSSMPVYENKPPSWPYTMDYKIFHDCMIPPCPTRSYPGVWEVPMVMWQDLNGGRCSMGDACSNPPASDGVYKMLIKNFERHFTSNRAPFGLFYHAAWFTQPHHKEGFIAFLDTITSMPEVWVVTNWQAIQWVRDPTPISRLNSFAPFQCNYQDRPKKCSNPKVCNLWHKSGVRYMRTCQACPEVYPWTGKTGVRNSRVENEIIDE